MAGIVVHLDHELRPSPVWEVGGVGEDGNKGDLEGCEVQAREGLGGRVAEEAVDAVGDELRGVDVLLLCGGDRGKGGGGGVAHLDR